MHRRDLFGPAQAAGFALWDQWCAAQTDAMQDAAMDAACAVK